MSPRLLRRLAIAVFALCVLLLPATVIGHITIARALGESVLLTPEGEVSPAVFSFLIFAFPLVGFLVTRRQPSNAIGWLLLGIGLCWGTRGFLFDIYLRWTLTVHPGSLPGAAVVGAIGFPLWVPGVGLIGTFLILLYPDGHLPSPRWRPVARASAVLVVGLYLLGVVRPGPVEQAPVPDLHNPLGIGWLEPIRTALDALVICLPICILACAVALVVRFRRSRGVERLQLKWLATAGAFVASGYLFVMVFSALAMVTHARSEPIWFRVFNELLFLSFGLIPAAIGVAVLKHGLYGLDRLISRTVSYAIVTGTLLAVYVALVTTVSTFRRTEDPLVVAASTLVVAALFQPVRRRVQASVDRRFNRARYDAGRTVEAFSTRLRDEVDLDSLRTDLITVVRETMAPSTVGVWLRPGEVRR